MTGGWLLKRIVFGNLGGEVRRGRGRKEKEQIEGMRADRRRGTIIESDGIIVRGEG